MDAAAAAGTISNGQDMAEYIRSFVRKSTLETELFSLETVYV